MTSKNRLIEFLRHLKTGQTAFEEKVGLTRGYVSHVKGSIGADMVAKISNIFPELNIEWLITGKGDMLASPDIAKEMQSIKTHYADKIKEEEDREFALASVTFVPLLPVSAQGGTLNDFIVSVHGYECEKVVSPVKGADFAITVSGDSMAPEYTSGSQVLIKKINENAFIDWGKTYVLDTCNGIVIKNILPGSDKACVRCESVNTKYPPFEVRFEDIYGIYRVLICMSMK